MALVADSVALRSRRKRAHAKGDHSLCEPGRCPEAGRAAAARILAAAPEAGPAAPSLTAAVASLVVGLPAGDPARDVLSASLQRCAEEIDAAGATAPLLRELRVTLAALCPPVRGPQPDWLDELHAKRAARRAAHGWPAG